MPLSFETQRRTNPEIALERNANEYISEAILERWPEQRYKACTERWESMIGSFPETIRALSIVPVSLNDEHPFNLEWLMDRYSEQTMPAEQWGILLSLNCVGNLNEDKVMTMLGTIDRARQKYIDRARQECSDPDTPIPPLNIATCIINYEEPQPISRIRSDIWDVALFEIYAKDILHDVVGISHDVDIWKMLPDHISKWVEIVTADPRFCYGGYAGYATLGPDELPANKYFLFINFLRELHTQRGAMCFENNMALTMNKYAAAGDWGDATLAEALTLLENFNHMRDNRPSDKKDWGDIIRWYKALGNKETAIKVSPRRSLYSLLNEIDLLITYETFTEGTSKERSASIEVLQDLVGRVTHSQVHETVSRVSRLMIGELDPLDIATVHKLYHLLDAKIRELGI